jgi:hypothetical protein
VRRLITLISAGRNRIVMIRRELPRTEGAGWVRRPYRPERMRILLTTRPLAVAWSVCVQPGGRSRKSAVHSLPAIPSSQESVLRRRQDPSRPSGSERRRAAGSRRGALTGGADARRSQWREWQASRFYVVQAAAFCCIWYLASVFTAMAQMKPSISLPTAVTICGLFFPAASSFL